MINRKLVETPVRMMNRMEEITDLICEYNEEVQKQQQEIERLNNIIKEVREEVKIYEVQSKDGITNELDNYVFVQRLKNVLNKGE